MSRSRKPGTLAGMDEASPEETASEDPLDGFREQCRRQLQRRIEDRIEEVSASCTSRSWTTRRTEHSSPWRSIGPGAMRTCPSTSASGRLQRVRHDPPTGVSPAPSGRDRVDMGDPERRGDRGPGGRGTKDSDSTLEERHVTPRRSFLTGLAAGLGGALCLSRNARAAEPAPSEPPPSEHAKPPGGDPAASESAARDLGALVKKNFSGRG